MITQLEIHPDHCTARVDFTQWKWLESLEGEPRVAIGVTVFVILLVLLLWWTSPWLGLLFILVGLGNLLRRDVWQMRVEQGYLRLRRGSRLREWELEGVEIDVLAESIFVKPPLGEELVLRGDDPWLMAEFGAVLLQWQKIERGSRDDVPAHLEGVRRDASVT